MIRPLKGKGGERLKRSYEKSWATESNQWIQLAEQNAIGWWATSALESNIGLNTISQWVSTKNCNMQQGLGTGNIYSNNIQSPLFVKNGKIFYGDSKKWNLSFFSDKINDPKNS